MKDLSIDIETYSDVSIKDAGLYKYVASNEFEILLFAYSIDFGEVSIIDLAQGEQIPDEVIKAMADNNVTKHAYNAAFEYNALESAGYGVGSLSAWRCTMFHSMYLGYPGSLKLVSNVLGSDASEKKEKNGTVLINYFSKPCKPTKANGGRCRNLPHHAPEKWELFKKYCVQDVYAEIAVFNRVSLFDIPEREWRVWELSERMNRLGVMIDEDLVCGALKIDSDLTEESIRRSKEISGLDNPNSNTQILDFLNREIGGVMNVTKATVEELLSRNGISAAAREFLELRQSLAKTSTTKYEKMAVCECSDSRIRGLLQCYGANRTGRWAGRLVQVQNLPRNYIDDLDTAREVIKSGDLETIKLIYGDVSDTLSQLIRTAFIAEDRKRFVVADYSAIEARVVAWLAGEEWVNEVFKTHGKIYEATASQMFHVPFELIKKGNPEYSLRQRGKVATLALGYQGGVSALIAMGADKMGLSEDEMADIVSRWRNANKNIVAFWKAIGDACIKVLNTGMPESVRGIVVDYECEGIYGQSFLSFMLPSGRKLYYPEPKLVQGKYGEEITFKSLKGVSWVREKTYGGKLTENIVQAIARDCLAELLLILDERLDSDSNVVMHIHDEVVIEASEKTSLNGVIKMMAEPIQWAPGLTLKGAGFESKYYMKD